jgi:hypothetical protein
MKQVLYVAAGTVLAIVASACSPSSPPETADTRAKSATEHRRRMKMPTVQMPHFKSAEDVPPGVLSRRQALQRAMKATRKFRLQLRSSTPLFGYHRTANKKEAENSPPPTPVWKIKMRGAFKYAGDCTADWQIVVHGRTGQVYESSTSGIKGRANCSRSAPG